MLLYGKPLADQIKIELKNQVSTLFPQRSKYVAILFFGENSSSTTYVHHKQKYATEIGLETFIFGQDRDQDISHFPHLKPRIQQEYTEVSTILQLIHFLNNDEDCVGIMIQLPLPSKLSYAKTQLLQSITESKDIDGLGGSLVGKSFFEMINFTPATPKAVMTLLDYYNLGNVRGKSVAIIGQSTIVGKPLALELLKRGAFVKTFDINNTPEEIQIACQSAEYIFAGTGHIHLINDRYINNKKNQILIDIGYGHLNGKPVGDIDFDTVKDKVKHITPVPGGVGPLTIASLFSNVIDLWKQRHLLS